MENMHGTIGIIAGILSLAGYIPYIISIVAGKTRPNKATWCIWTLVGGLLAFSYLSEGDPNSIWLPLAYFFGPFITAILSFRYGYSEWTKLDIACIIIAIVSIIPWLLSKDATITLLINLLIDATGAVPTVLKSYHEPETEDFTAWGIFWVANTLQLFAISMWNIASLYPIYLFILATSIFAFIIRGKILHRKKH